MKTILKILLLWVILLYGHIGLASIAHDHGYELALYGNLPHRSLGCLWTAHMLMPYRQDYAEDYLCQYVWLTKEEMMAEGSREPVMLRYAIQLKNQFPESKRIRACYQYLKSHRA